MGGQGYDQRLLDAVSGGDRKTAIELIDKGEGINEAYEVSGDTPLDLAAARGDMGLVKLLLEHGANPHHKNDIDRTSDQLTSDIRIKDMIRKARSAH